MAGFKIAPLHGEGAGMDMVNGNYITRIKAINLSPLIAAAPCGDQFAVNLAI